MYLFHLSLVKLVCQVKSEVRRSVTNHVYTHKEFDLATEASSAESSKKKKKMDIVKMSQVTYVTIVP